jgi:hypothetical protein
MGANTQQVGVKVFGGGHDLRYRGANSDFRLWMEMFEVLGLDQVCQSLFTRLDHLGEVWARDRCGHDSVRQSQGYVLNYVQEDKLRLELFGQESTQT